MLGIVTNLSQGGCYVETSGLLLPGSQYKLTFSHENTNVTIEGEVVRMDLGIGAALKFSEATHATPRRLAAHPGAFGQHERER